MVIRDTAGFRKLPCGRGVEKMTDTSQTKERDRKHGTWIHIDLPIVVIVIFCDHWSLCRAKVVLALCHKTTAIAHLAERLLPGTSVGPCLAWLLAPSPTVLRS